MSAHVKGYHNSYTVHQRNDETVRETEAHALLSCASRLEAACRPDCSREEFVDAIRHNQHLWTLFQVTLCEPDNMLPGDLKALLLNISRYVDKASFSAIGDGNPGLLKGLVSINRTIAAGLRTKSGEAKTADLSSSPVSGSSESVRTTA